LTAIGDSVFPLCMDTNNTILLVPLDAETEARLRRLSAVCKDDMAHIAASLLHDLLEDDEFYNESRH
jgi:hypothetical protein